MDMLELRNKWLKIRASKQGGSILDGVLADGRAFLRPYCPKSSTFNSLETACFPLVPLGNRVAGNSFEFGSQNHKLYKNSEASPFYIHGDGWLSEWQVESHTDESIVMTLSHNAHENSPYTYSVKQTIRLEENALIISLELTNQGEKLPFGLGLHPYFPRSNDVLLKASAEKFWTLDNSNLPDAEIEISTAHDFSLPKCIVDDLDNCFSDWDGEAKIVYSDSDLKIDIQCSEIFSNYLIYSPKNADYFCFEPMSHVPNGLNMADLGGMRILEKGESLSGQMRLTVTDIDSLVSRAE